MDDVKDNSKHDLARLFKEIAPAARSYLSRRGCSEADIEDYLQEAFLRLWSKQSHIQAGVERSYLMRMLHNMLVDNYRKTKSRPFCEYPQEDFYQIPAPDNRSSQKARRLLIDSLQEAAKDPRAKTFVMQMKQGMTLDQIAHAVHAPTGTVAAQIARYRHRFTVQVQRTWECSAWC